MFRITNDLEMLFDIKILKWERVMCQFEAIKYGLRTPCPFQMEEFLIQMIKRKILFPSSDHFL